ncbi:MAG: hypothetical protein ABWX60_08725 [Aeromicrobium sp.]
MKNSARIGALVAGLALSLGPLTAPAHADRPTTEPCATQTTQVARAEAQLAKVNSVFAKQQAKVKKAKKAVVEADTRAEKRQAAKKLKVAKERRTKVAKTKKAQLQRVAKAKARLAKCLASQPAA